MSQTIGAGDVGDSESFAPQGAEPHVVDVLGVTELEVELLANAGESTDHQGGEGGKVTATLDVTDIDTVELFVPDGRISLFDGGQGNDGNGVGPGGRGGGDGGGTALLRVLEGNTLAAADAGGGSAGEDFYGNDCGGGGGARGGGGGGTDPENRGNSAEGSGKGGIGGLRTESSVDGTDGGGTVPAESIQQTITEGGSSRSFSQGGAASLTIQATDYPEFTFDSVTFPDSILTETAAEIDYEVTNSGVETTQDVELLVDDEVVTTTPVTVAKSETVSETITWTPAQADAGQRELTLQTPADSEQATVDVVGPDYQVAIESTNSPIGAGETLEVDVEVTNTGGGGEQDLTLDVEEQ